MSDPSKPSNTNLTAMIGAVVLAALLMLVAILHCGHLFAQWDASGVSWGYKALDLALVGSSVGAGGFLIRKVRAPRSRRGPIKAWALAVACLAISFWLAVFGF